MYEKNLIKNDLNSDEGIEFLIKNEEDRSKCIVSYHPLRIGAMNVMTSDSY